MFLTWHNVPPLGQNVQMSYVIECLLLIFVAFPLHAQACDLDYKSAYKDFKTRFDFKLKSNGLENTQVFNPEDERIAAIMSSSGPVAFVSNIHGQISEEAMKNIFTCDCQNQIINANTYQDIGADKDIKTSHFDNNKICESYRAIESNFEGLKRTSSKNEKLILIGKMMHAIQDFYSHANYVDEVIASNQEVKPPDIELFDFDVFCPRGIAYKKIGEVFTGNYDGSHSPFGMRRSKEDIEDSRSHYHINKDFSPYSDPKVAAYYSPDSLKKSENGNGQYYFDFVSDLQIRASKMMLKKVKDNGIVTDCNLK
jgi:hypothetical protein